MKDNKINYTDNDRAIVAALKGTEGLTLAQLNEGRETPFVAGHLVSAMKKGLIVADREIEVIKPSTRKVSTYNYVTSDVLRNAEGKDFNYTENETNLLSFASKIESPFTLAQLAAAMGVEKVFSGSINGLVKKGNITKGDEVEVATTSKSKVKVYIFNQDIPE